MFPRLGVPVWNVPEKCSRVRLYWEEGEERTTKYKPKGKPERLAFCRLVRFLRGQNIHKPPKFDIE